MLFSLKAVDVTSLRKQGFKAFFFFKGKPGVAFSGGNL